MDQILDTPQSTETSRLEYAGFWIRVASTVIDGIVLTVGVWIVIFVLGLLLISSTGTDADIDPDMAVAGGVGFYALIIIGYLLYFALMESSARQATLGKMAVGIKVGDAHGKKLSFANALGRTAAKWISQLLFYIGYMMVGWDERKQGLHDKIAGTFVFYSK